MNLREDILLLNTLMNNNDFIKKIELATYFNSNEDIYAYLKYMNIKGHNVLTVTGSGDQTLYSILLGAINIDTFDINRLSYYILELKIAAIKALKQEEYISYFPVIDNKKENYSLKAYKRIRDYLELNAKIFWDYLYHFYGPDHIDKMRCDERVIVYENPYFSEENYDILKNKIDNVPVNYYDCDLRYLSESIKKSKYSAIILSNIFDYMHYSQKNAVDNYYKFLDKEINPLLVSHGNCMAYYSFNNDYNYLKKLNRYPMKDGNYFCFYK